MSEIEGEVASCARRAKEEDLTSPVTLSRRLREAVAIELEDLKMEEGERRQPAAGVGLKIKQPTEAMGRAESALEMRSGTHRHDSIEALEI